MLSNHLILWCPLLLCLQSFPASKSFPMSWLFVLGGQSIGTSTSGSVLPMNIQGWFPLGLTGWISLQSKGCFRVSSNTRIQKHQFLVISFLYGPTLTSVHDYWKNHSFDYTQVCWQSDVFAFWYTVIAFLSRNKCLLILWLQSSSTVIWSPRK